MTTPADDPAVRLPVAADDAAWVRVDSRLDERRLWAFCRDLERLYRINPLSEFRSWRRTGPDSHRAELNNLSNDREIVLELTREDLSGNEFRVDYAEGIKRCTWFRIEPHAGGSALLIVDDYSRLPPAEREKRMDEVDRSLTAWGHGIYRYLELERRWGWLPPWRWYMRRLWVPMKPMARRVSWMLILVNLVFFVLFLLVALIFWIEQGRS
jgi:hypothetical protein